MTHITTAKQEIRKLLMKLQEPGNVDQTTIDCYNVIGVHLEQALTELTLCEHQVCSLGIS
ncbi:MAG: hypothetical protein ACTSPB_10195 [Candidatus Thorarchaeota archaeon]